MKPGDIKQAIENLPAGERQALARWLTEHQRTASYPQRSLRYAVWWSLAAVFSFLALDAAIFRSGWYSNFLEPNSTTGQVEYHLMWLRRAAPAKVPEVLVIGDSRIAEGFSARTAAAAVHDALHFTNFGMPGSSPRVWYYVLRDADPTRHRFSRIVLALDHYSDEDWGEDIRNRREDLNYLAERLKPTDCRDFAHSFPDRTLKPAILAGCLFPATVLRPDVLAFLSNIPDRLARAGDWRNNGAGYIDGYGGKPEELTGLTVDEEKHTIHFPPDLKDWQTNTIKNTVLPDTVPQTGALTSYRKLWLGRILDLYKGTGATVVFLQIPRAPWPIPDSKVPARFLDSIAGRPGVEVLPSDTFKSLETPELFADGLHLNHKGRPMFSTILAEKLVGTH